MQGNKQENIGFNLIIQAWNYKKEEYENSVFAMRRFSEHNPQAGAFYKFIAGIGGAAEYSFTPKGLPDGLDDESKALLSKPGSFSYSYLTYDDMLDRVKSFSKYHNRQTYVSLEDEYYDIAMGNYQNPSFLPPVIESSQIEGVDYIIDILDELHNIEDRMGDPYSRIRIVFSFYRH